MFSGWPALSPLPLRYRLAVVFAGLLVAYLLYLCTGFGPHEIAPSRSLSSIVVGQEERIRLQDERLRLRNDVRTTFLQSLIQVLAGVAVLLGVWVTWEQLNTDRDQVQQQLALTRQRQVADRFTHAVDQVGSKELDRQMGGIYGLEQIAKESQEAMEVNLGGDSGHFDDGTRKRVFEFLASYVREHSHRQPTGNPKEALLQARFADVQLALTALGRRTPCLLTLPLI